jgi:phenylacetate-CoA ligase
MALTTPQERRRRESLELPQLRAWQLQRLNQLLETILPQNRFYAQKLGQRRRLDAWDDLLQLPFTTKEELVAGQSAEGLAPNRTYPLEQYTRFHQTSGTRGRPLVVLDTAEDWPWWLECWQYVLDAADLGTADRLLMAFSFGPFIGFWTAFEAALARGCLVVPGGGMTTLSRLELLRTSQATAVFCTPSYALHMSEVAAQHGIGLAGLPVRRLILAGEPGGSVPAIRQRIEQAWNARVIDHCGATEVGAWGYPDAEGRGLHVLESEFIAEFLPVSAAQGSRHAPGDEPNSDRLDPADGELAELVLTALGRTGSPVIRYRTGDLVRPTWNHPGANRFVFLEGGVLGRSDDMLIVRGVNVFPSSIEQILRSFPEVDEYRLTALKAAEMDQLEIEIEDRLDRPGRVAEELQLRLGLKVVVRCVPLGSLPRFDGKGRRFVDRRGSATASPAGSVDEGV